MTNEECVVHLSLERADATLHYAACEAPASDMIADADRLVSVLTDLRHWAAAHSVGWDSAVGTSASWYDVEHRDYCRAMAARRTA